MYVLLNNGERRGCISFVLLNCFDYYRFFNLVELTEYIMIYYFAYEKIEPSVWNYSCNKYKVTVTHSVCTYSKFNSWYKPNPALIRYYLEMFCILQMCTPSVYISVVYWKYVIYMAIYMCILIHTRFVWMTRGKEFAIPEIINKNMY